MNDQKLYELIARTPKIRAVQIADALSQELVDVSDALRPLVEMGDVVQSAGFTPKGNPTQVYELSAEFKRSKDGTAILARIAAQGAESGRASTPAPSAVPQVPTSAPLPAPAAWPSSPSKVDRAIGYISEHGQASSAQLREVMGLVEKTGSPSSYLKCALQDGRVKWDGKVYTLGADPKPRGTAFGGALSLPGSTPLPRSPAKAVSPRPSVAAPPAPGPAVSPSTFRCGIWLDDVIEMQRDGAPVGTLARAEALVLRDFLNRVFPEAACLN